MISSRRSSPSTLLHNSPHSHRNWKSVSHHRAWINFYVHVFRRNSHLLTNKFATCFVHPTVHHWSSPSIKSNLHKSNVVAAESRHWLDHGPLYLNLPPPNYVHAHQSIRATNRQQTQCLVLSPTSQSRGLIFWLRCTMDRLLNSGMHF